MNDLAIEVSAEALNWIYLLLLYTTVGGMAYRWLMPRLTPNARILAAVFLAAQILVLVISQTIDSPSHFVRGLWVLTSEWNAPSTLAFTQLATVGALALMLGWLARGGGGAVSVLCRAGPALPLPVD